MMKNKKIAIIGAGIAGMVAGCYGQMNGYDTEIFEMHDLPGGFCTAWRRKGYTFDGCIKWLMGTSPQSPLREMWKTVGALDGEGFVYRDVLAQIETLSGKKLILYSDVAKLEEHLLELAPGDAAAIREFTDEIRSCADWSKVFHPDLNDKYYTMTGKDFAEQFQDPFLRETFARIIPGGYLRFFLMQLVVYCNRDAAWPIGGSLEFARRIERKYLKLGGKMHYRSKVEAIVVREDRATGVRLEDGTVHDCDYLIAAADGYSTIFELLSGKYCNAEIKKLYETAPITSSSLQISLGVDCDLSGEPRHISLELDHPLQIGGREITRLSFRHYCYEPTFAPPGKSVVVSLLPADYNYWEQLYRQDRQAYRKEKREVAATLIAALERRFPATRGKVEVADVATPVTFNRYTGSRWGAYMGWLTPDPNIPVTLPGLQGLYMAGQWTDAMSGLPTALITGRESVARICKEDAKEFVG
jgi:phytoene dehydrogenase-like protein